MSNYSYNIDENLLYILYNVYINFINILYKHVLYLYTFIYIYIHLYIILLCHDKYKTLILYT